MAENNVFEKIHVDERDKADLSGLLEQLNLPPAVVEYVRKNQKAVYIVLSVIAAAVIFWSLYGSYVENRIASSSSALTIAMKAEADSKVSALQKVVDDFSGTDSALWAKIEIAQVYISEKEYEKSLTQYSEVRQELNEGNPLYSLVTFGIAQSQEALEKFDSAVQEYSRLKSIKGYENIGYNGTARIYEVQEKYSDAVRELEEYQGVLIGESPDNPEKAYIANKINRLKALM